ncbi:MAG TPA: ABC transporter permease subunit [Methylomirabilota bacterium]|nr:ABC transporter permease subunit [Methylomirabilota bacterium]
MADPVATSFPPQPRVFRRLFPSGKVQSRLVDAVVFLTLAAILYGLWRAGQLWIGPATPEARISLHPSILPYYAFLSLVRIAIGYVLSLVFALVYGYAAARWGAAERVLIPLLDILQSIPVLSFLPPVMLGMVALFPHRQAGLELGSILLIFTGQAWNIAFSFYASLKSIPREFHEAADIYRFSLWQKFLQLDVPYAAIGLVWNSMMSIAAAWFYLMACEMFELGQRDFRLPGLGSYLQLAASNGDSRAIAWGLAAMIGVIVLLDQLLWRPVIAWADKFKMESVESSSTPRSAVLTMLRRSGVPAAIHDRLIHPIGERLMAAASRRAAAAEPVAPPKRSPAVHVWFGRAFVFLIIAVLAWFAFLAARRLVLLSSPQISELLLGAAATFARVEGSLLLGALWTIPVGVAIGLSPRLARFAQPIVQVAASVPATALFPVVLLLLLRLGGGMGIAAVALMLLGTQWYILFNVIAGAMAIPSDLREVAQVYRFGRWERWRGLILPAIFPYLITGLLTASGGAWNASIVAEYFHFGNRTLHTIGLGSIISRSTDLSQMDVLLAATLLMAIIVVVMNRLVWRRLYRLAETRFKLET